MMRIYARCSAGGEHSFTCPEDFHCIGCLIHYVSSPACYTGYESVFLGYMMLSNQINGCMVFKNSDIGIGYTVVYQGFHNLMSGGICCISDAIAAMTTFT